MCEHLKDGYILLPYQKLGCRTNLGFFLLQISTKKYLCAIQTLFNLKIRGCLHIMSAKMGCQDHPLLNLLGVRKA